MERSILTAERIRVWEFGIFDQAQVQDRESSHYGRLVLSPTKSYYITVPSKINSDINIQKVSSETQNARSVSIIHIYMCVVKNKRS